MDVASLSLELEEKRKLAEVRMDRIRDILQAFGPRASPAYDRLLWHLDEIALDLQNLHLEQSLAAQAQVKLQ